MKKIIVIFLLILLVGAAQAKTAGTNSAEFLKVSVGAKGVGMGEAYTALAEGAEAVYWNPAGIAGQELVEISSMYGDWYQDVTYQHIGLVLPVNKIGPLGLSYSLLNYGTIPGYDNTGARIDNISANDSQLTISWAKKVNKKLSFGVNLKQISEKLDTVNASTYAYDFGLRFNPRENIIFAAVTKNQNGKLKFISEEASVPSDTVIGLGVKKFIAEPLTVGIDYVISNSEDNYFNYGAEYNYSDYLALRLGSQNSKLQGGVGFRAASFNLDYAYVPHDDLGATHRVSFSLKFGINKQYEIDLYYKKGKGFYRRKEYLNALAEFKKALEINPLDKSSREFVDRIVEEMRNETLKEKVRALIERKNQSGELLKQAIISYQQNEFGQAHELVEKSLKLTPKNKKALQLKSRLDKIIKIEKGKSR